ncbi:MAG: TonB-dependent receptor [Proteobacteria bacterium]|nr:TonB-dependent receptor [Pseudomonadota bacterium]
MRLAKIAITVTLALSLGEQAICQTDEEEDLALAYGDRNFVSIATGSKQLLRKAPSVATVITAQDIANMGARTVDEALESVPGLHVSRATMNYGANYSIRGILTESNPHVLLMVNGVPWTSAYQGNRGDMPFTLPVENVSRIEVIRGPGSAMYGADAFAGTINVITKTADEIGGTSVGLRAGSFNSWDSWIQHGSRIGGLEIAGYLKIGATDGQRQIVQADAQTSIDALGFSPAASLAPGRVNLGNDDFSAQLDLALGGFRWRNAFNQRDNAAAGVGIAGAIDPTGRYRTARFNSDLSWNDANLTPDLGISLQASFMHMANEITTPATLYPAGAFFGAFPNGMIGAPEKWEKQFRLSASGIYTGFADHRIRFGLGHDEMNIYKTKEWKNFTLLGGGPFPSAVPWSEASGTNLFLSPHKRHVEYVYAQDEWSFARQWTLTAGVRYDNYSDFGSTTNPRVALVWDAHEDLTAKLMYGSAFRAPSFVEQYATSNPVARGNSSLSPETITTLEASLAWQTTERLHTTLSVFRHKIQDIIALSGSSYQNTGKQRGNGGEVEISWDASTNLRLSGNYAYQHNIDERTGQDTGYAPHQILHTRAEWRFATGWHLNGQINYVADRQRAPGDARTQIPDYTSIDLTLRTDRNKAGWDFSASVYNLLNADIREPSITSSGIVFDLPMPGRTVWLQARYSL